MTIHKLNGITIRTTYVYPPIPDRRFDWSAIDDDTYDGEGCPVGRGATEEEAIQDLCDQVFELPEPCTQVAYDLGCTCRMSTVNSASIDPPEPIVNEWCPVHGRDPDQELQRRRDNE